MKHSILVVKIHYGSEIAAELHHMIDATGDLSPRDIDGLMTKASALFAERTGDGPSMVMAVNTGDPAGYAATMAKRTHDMWGNRI